MASPLAGWAYPTPDQEDFIYGSDTQELTQQELQDLKADYDDYNEAF